MKKHLLKLLLLCCIGILALSLFACVPSTEQYKVDFVVDGEVYSSRTTSGNSRVSPPSDPVKSQYIFRGWYFDEGEWTKEFRAYSFEKDPINSDVTVYAWFELDEAHECNKQWKTTVKATCLTEGRKVLACAYPECKKVYETETIPVTTDHVTIETVKTVEKEATCLDAGVYKETYYCSLCKQKVENKKGNLEEIIYTEIDNNAHNYAETGVLKKVGNIFVFSATCSNENEFCEECKHELDECNCIKCDCKESCKPNKCEHEIVINDIEVTEIIITNPTCTEQGLKKYVCTVYGVKYYSEVEVIPALGHKLSGVAINDKTVYKEKDNGSLFSKITLIADSKTCGAETEGIFTCETCNELSTIKVEKPHIGTWVKTQDPQCYKAGVETLASCSACGGTNLTRAIPPTNDHIDGDTILVHIGNEFHVAKACSNRNLGCTHVDIVIKDVAVTSKEIISNSCKVDDVIRYTYNASGKTYYCDEVMENGTGHFLNGVRSSTLIHKDGWFDYRYITDDDVEGGIKLFAERVLSCDEMVHGYYICESCNELDNVMVYRPHSGTWITEKNPTCTTEGVSHFYCDFCDFGDKNEADSIKAIPMTDHNYVLSLKPKDVENPELAYFYLSGKCADCDATFEKDYVSASVSVSKVPTCVSLGELEYKCVYNGETYKYTKSIPMVAHVFEGVAYSESDRFDYVKYVLTGKIKLADGAIAVCVADANDKSRDAEATLTCDNCKNSLKTKVYRVHDCTVQTFLDIPKSPCITSGKKEYICSYKNCSYTNTEVINEVNHKYNAVLTENADGSYNIKAVCTKEGCSVESSVVEYKNIDYVSVKVKVAATCCNSGAVEYTFKDAKGISVTINAVIDRGNHVLNGVDYTTLLVGGKLPAGTTDIVKVNSKTYFKCEKCNQLVEVVVASNDE